MRNRFIIQIHLFILHLYLSMDSFDPFGPFHPLAHKACVKSHLISIVQPIHMKRGRKAVHEMQIIKPMIMGLRACSSERVSRVQENNSTSDNPKRQNNTVCSSIINHPFHNCVLYRCTVHPSSYQMTIERKRKTTHTPASLL